MAATLTQAASSYQQFPGSRNDTYSTISYSATPAISNSVSPSRKLPVFTSIKSSNDSRGSFLSSSKSNRQHALRSTLRNIDTTMPSGTASTSIATTTTKRSESQHTRLHKRGGSAASLPGSPAVLNTGHAQFSTPYATYEEPFPDISLTPSNSTPKIKPYLRKIGSVSKEDADQGRLDLSKSVSENEALAGLGIQDFGTRTDSFQSGRRTPHARTTSVGSQVSTGSGSFRPTQPFVHPMRQTPNRAYTPTPPPDTMSMNDEETRESSDIVPDEDVQPGLGLRSGRSTSISSGAQVAAPTPLSQTLTAADLGYVPKLTSSSQTNLSIKSSKSMKSSKSKLGRPRTDTNRSIEYVPSPSSRTSLDKSFSFVSRRSDPDAAPSTTRDERIRAARRKFEEKEADKDRKIEQEALKRQQSELAKHAKKEDRQRRKSEASTTAAVERPRIPKAKSLGNARERRDELRAMRYDDSKVTALPTQGMEPGKSEKAETVAMSMESSESSQHGGWTRFSAWLQTRMLSCGRKRS